MYTPTARLRGRTRTPLERIERKMPLKNKFINFRATEKEIQDLEILVKKAKMTKADFIRHSIFNKDIVVIDGIKELQQELKRIGNNLNQLTTRANLGQLTTVNLRETKDELAKIHEILSEIYRKKSELTAVETVAVPSEVPQKVAQEISAEEEETATPSSALMNIQIKKNLGFFGRNRG